MIDTLKLRINGRGKFEVRRKSLFHPEFQIRTFYELPESERVDPEGSLRYSRAFRLYSKPLGFYLPKVEIYEEVSAELQTVDYKLNIELSAAKLIFENNLLELEETHKERFFSTLKDRLEEVGIYITTEALKEAEVSWLHVGKNILLPKDLHLREIIEEFSKLDVSKVFDASKVRFANGGDMFQIYSGSREIVFYNKTLDMLKTRSLSVDKYKTDFERQFVYDHGLDSREILRFEYRLKKGESVRSEVNKILARDPKTKVRAEDVFSNNLWKTLLLKNWNNLIHREANQLLLVRAKNPLTLLVHILNKAALQDKNGHSQNKALISFGLATVIKECGPGRALREIKRAWSEGHSERLDEKVREAAELVNDLPYPDHVPFISRELEKFEQISLALLEKNA